MSNTKLYSLSPADKQLAELENFMAAFNKLRLEFPNVVIYCNDDDTPTASIFDKATGFGEVQSCISFLPLKQ